MKEWGEADDLLSSDRVEIRYGSLDSDEYFDRLEASDVLLMPTPPSYYKGCTSGIFTEGVAFGKVCIVPRGAGRMNNLRPGTVPVARSGPSRPRRPRGFS